MKLASDTGAGSVLALALVLALTTFGLAGVGLAAALAVRQSVVGASDLAALAAADAASGAVPAAPCEVAARVTRANGTRLIACSLDGLIVSVTVAGSVGGIQIVSRSRAGPP